MLLFCGLRVSFRLISGYFRVVGFFGAVLKFLCSFWAAFRDFHNYGSFSAVSIIIGFFWVFALFLEMFGFFGVFGSF